MRKIALHSLCCTGSGRRSPCSKTGGGGGGEWGGGGSPSAFAKVGRLDDTLDGIDVVPPTGADGPTPDSPLLTNRK